MKKRVVICTLSAVLALLCVSMFMVVQDAHAQYLSCCCCYECNDGYKGCFTENFGGQSGPSVNWCADEANAVCAAHGGVNWHNALADGSGTYDVKCENNVCVPVRTPTPTATEVPTDTPFPPTPTALHRLLLPLILKHRP